MDLTRERVPRRLGAKAMKVPRLGDPILTSALGIRVECLQAS